MEAIFVIVQLIEFAVNNSSSELNLNNLSYRTEKQFWNMNFI